MKKLVTLASIALLPAVLAACGSSSSSNSNADKQSDHTLMTPKATGDISLLKWGVAGSEPASLDWIYDWDYGPSNLILSNMCEGLTRQNPDGTTTPALATKVSQPNSKTYVFTIRQGVKFADGKPMTVDDVAYSLNRNLTAKPPSYWGFWYENVASIAASGSDTVKVKLKQPDALFGEVMSTPAGYVGEKAYIEQEGAKYGTPGGGVMCTGPFGFKSWTKGQSVTLERNPYYWDSALKAKAQTLEFSFIPDASALDSALVTGSVDGASGMTVSSLKPLANASDGKLYVNQGTETVVMQLNNLTSGPLQDQRIREALRDVVDYKGITEGLMTGYAAPANTLTPPASWGTQADIYKPGLGALPGGEQDMSNAEKLVKEAGAPSQPIVIGLNSDDQSIVNAATSIQASAAQIGLKIEVKQYPANEFTNLFYDEKARSAVNVLMNNVTVDVPNPLQLNIQVIPGSPFNYTGIDDKQLASTLSQAAATSDPTQQANLTVKASKIFADHVYGISLYSLDARVFLNNKVTGAPVSTLSQWYYPWAATVGAS